MTVNETEKQPSGAARQQAFEILRRHPDCLRDDTVQDELLEDIAAALSRSQGEADAELIARLENPQFNAYPAHGSGFVSIITEQNIQDMKRAALLLRGGSEQTASRPGSKTGEQQ